jgi:hypothetical protein
LADTFLADGLSKTVLVELLGRYSNQANDLKRTRRILAMEQRSWPVRMPTVVQPQRRVADRLDEVMVAELVQGYLAGMPGRELAERFRLARSTIIKVLKDHGVAVRHPRVTPEAQAEMARLYQAGVRQVEIAEQFGRSPGLVWHVLERAGVFKK